MVVVLLRMRWCMEGGAVRGRGWCRGRTGCRCSRNRWRRSAASPGTCRVCVSARGMLCLADSVEV